MPGYFDAVKAEKAAPAPPPTSNVVPIRPKTDGIHPYAEAIRTAWMNRLATLKARPWVSGDAWDTNCFVTARKLIELANSQWAGYSVAQARADYDANAPHNTAWDQREKCWRQAEAKTGGASLPAPAEGETYVLPEVTVLTGPDETTVLDFWNARPILTHLHDFARARCVAPWAVLGNAMARVIAATHHSVALPPIVAGYASLNLFVGVVGRSGSGKGAAEAVARDALDVGHVEVRNTGSGEGVLHAYVKRSQGGLEQHTDSVLFSVPEIDSLGAVGARQGATIMPLLRSAWSGEQLGFQYADPAKNLLIRGHGYRLCLVAGIQPGRAGTLLDDEDGGTPQRFLWMPATDPDAPDDLPSEPAPMTWTMNAPVVLNAAGFKPFVICEQARTLIRTERQKANRGEVEALDGHGLLTRLKTAAALALFEKRHEVTDEDWELSGVIMAVSDATRNRVIAQRQAELAKANASRAVTEAHRQMIVSETVAEKAVARVAKRLHRSIQGDAIARSEARRSLASRDREYFEEALDHLIKSGLVRASEAETGVILTSTEEKA